jgi:hypothetical protein
MYQEGKGRMRKPTRQTTTSATQSVWIFDIDKLRPGDVVLERGQGLLRSPYELAIVANTLTRYSFLEALISWRPSISAAGGELRSSAASLPRARTRGGLPELAAMSRYGSAVAVDVLTELKPGRNPGGPICRSAAPAGFLFGHPESSPSHFSGRSCA